MIYGSYDVGDAVLLNGGHGGAMADFQKNATE